VQSARWLLVTQASEQLSMWRDRGRASNRSALSLCAARVNLAFGMTVLDGFLISADKKVFPGSRCSLSSQVVAARASCLVVALSRGDRKRPNT
jgi:hypothetical protein